MGGLPTSEFQSMFGGHRDYNLGFVKPKSPSCNERTEVYWPEIKKNMVKLYFISKVKASITTKPALKPTG